MVRIKTIGIASLALGATLIAGSYSIANGANGAAKGREQAATCMATGENVSPGFCPQQTSALDDKTPGMGKMQRKGMMKGEGNRMGAALNLSEEQQAQAKAIFEKAREEAVAVAPELAKVMGEIKDRMTKRLEGLDLTDEQQAKIAAIRETTKTKSQAIMQDDAIAAVDKRTKLQELHRNSMQQTMAVLTDEQRASLKDMRGNKGQRLERPQMTEEQRSKLQEIREKARTDFEAILTPEQKQKAEELRATGQEMRGQRQGRQGGARGQGGQRGQGMMRGDGTGIGNRGVNENCPVADNATDNI